MYYLSRRTINLLAEMGDGEALWAKDNINHINGFVSRNGTIKFGPMFWDKHYNNKVRARLKRLNHPTFAQTVTAWPMLRKE